MATDKIMVDDEEIAGVELSKEEKKRLKRQEKKLKKFGLKDESKMGKMELFFYRMEKRRKIKKKKRVSRSVAGDISLFILLCLFGLFSAYPLSVLLLNHLQNCLYTHLNYSSKILH